MITTPAEKFFVKLCQALETDWYQDTRFHSITARLDNQDELDRLLGARTAHFSRVELVDRLIAADVLTAPINKVEDVVRDPQILHNRMITQVQHPTLGEVGVTGVPIRFYGTPCEVRKHPPLLGEHTRELLLEAGYTEAEITELIASGLAADHAEIERQRAARRARKAPRSP